MPFLEVFFRLNIPIILDKKLFFFSSFKGGTSVAAFAFVSTPGALLPLPLVAAPSVEATTVFDAVVEIGLGLELGLVCHLQDR